MRISERFSNNYLRAEDVVTPLTHIIQDINEVMLGDDERIVIEFSDTDKVLPLNKTNALTLSEELGDDTDAWIGMAITMYRAKVMFNGKNVPALRVRVASDQPPPRPQHRKVKAVDEPAF